MIHQPPVHFLGKTLTGQPVQKQVRKLKDLDNIFLDQAAFSAADMNRVVYEVFSYLPVDEGTEGGLFFGMTHLYPGTVGQEFYMTKGHFHTIENRAEYYWCVEGEGMLLMMDKHRNTWAEQMQPGSLHYIDGYTAHRVANTGGGILSFGACWPSDAGHDYATIVKNGFSRRLLSVEGKPALV
ncbi:glucose-6-phosphate isomerase family protein [Chitinophaga barathri]|uniref:glucose-6-phosphate isomerase n=1 Tax=Chitinophaga barathri TaxID=1647451 RepID=A0A3N4MS74_9BACT|nr:glucose-6-phosphate isomerase family protein [Chitinophaga barathri]RPD42990.1 glucose-6-phosphate isomerase [Chitinophaga barathri]